MLFVLSMDRMMDGLIHMKNTLILINLLIIISAAWTLATCS